MKRRALCVDVGLLHCVGTQKVITRPHLVETETQDMLIFIFKHTYCGFLDSLPFCVGVLMVLSDLS